MRSPTVHHTVTCAICLHDFTVAVEFDGVTPPEWSGDCPKCGESIRVVKLPYGWATVQCSKRNVQSEFSRDGAHTTSGMACCADGGNLGECPDRLPLVGRLKGGAE